MADQRHEIAVLSDLHLGEGRIPGSASWSSTEDFFHDEALARFLDHLRASHADDPSRLVLVLNGDTFDFLTVTSVPDDAEASRRGFQVSPSERKFGLNPSEAKSVYKLDVIFRGHRRAFHALSMFAAAGHRIEILRGNHDLELYFEAVRERILEHLSGFEDAPPPGTIRERVRFHQWFYLEPGRVYIEHGNQYDAANSNRYPLRPMLATRRWWRRDEEDLLDYPIGSIFVKYFYNRVRRLDPYTPRFLSFDQYVDFIRRYNPFDVWRVYRDHYPHFITALGPANPTGSWRSSEEDDARQEADFDSLSGETEPSGLYRELSSLKIHPESASKIAIVRRIIEPVLRRGLWLAVFAFAALYAWLLVFQLIQSVPWLAANAFLLSLFAVITVGAAAWAWFHLSRKLRRRKVRTVETCAERAARISEIARVPLVLMGHTHIVDHRPLGAGGATYANSGTWTSVDNPWKGIMRDARRYTFLLVRGSSVDLKRWNDDAGRVDDVPFFDTEEEELSHPLVEGTTQ